MTRNRHCLINTKPASFFGARWKDATPLGNGETGVLALGGIKTEELIVTRHDLWHWEIEGELPDVHETLQKARDAMDEGNYTYANNALTKSLREAGYNNRLAVPFPLGKVMIQIGKEAPFYHYNRILDMQHALLKVLYEVKTIHGNERYIREGFVSCTDDVIAYHIENQDGDVEALVGAELCDTGNADSVRMQEETKDSLENHIVGDMICFGYQNDDKMHTGLVIKVINDGGQVTYKNNHIAIKSAKAVTILVKTFLGVHDDFKCKADELNCLKFTYEELRQRHMQQFEKKYSSCSLTLNKEPYLSECSNERLIELAYDGDISNALVEKLWLFGRYLFLSGTSENTNPFSLYGLWNGEFAPEWAQNVANENVEMIYWHINVGGMAEYARALIHYYYQKIPGMQENAKKLFGCRGIFVSVYSTPKNTYVNPVVPVIVNWIGGAGWLCRHFYEYFRYTKDEKLFKEEILPFMLEAASFYEDYVCYDDTGKIKIYPSVSPENSPANFVSEENFRHLGHALPVVVNATMDYAIIKELLTNLIEISETYPLDEDRVRTWKKMKQAIPAYQINEDGAVREWMDPGLKDYYYHRHLSHLYPVFPGNEVNEHTDEKLYRAFERAVDLRELGGQVGWSLMHMAAIYSRLHRAEDAFSCLNLIPKAVLLPNLFMMSNDYRGMGVSMDVGQFAPIQLDANMGFVNAVQEMLFCYQKNLLVFLPACPKAWNKGEIKGFCFPDGKLDFSWDFEKHMFRAEIVFTGTIKPEVIIPEALYKQTIIWK